VSPSRCVLWSSLSKTTKERSRLCVQQNALLKEERETTTTVRCRRGAKETTTSNKCCLLFSFRNTKKRGFWALLVVSTPRLCETTIASPRRLCIEEREYVFLDERSTCARKTRMARARCSRWRTCSYSEMSSTSTRRSPEAKRKDGRAVPRAT